MPTKIKHLRDRVTGELIYPYTHADAVIGGNGNSVGQEIEGIDTRLEAIEAEGIGLKPVGDVEAVEGGGNASVKPKDIHIAINRCIRPNSRVGDKYVFTQSVKLHWSFEDIDGFGELCNEENIESVGDGQTITVNGESRSVPLYYKIQRREVVVEIVATPTTDNLDWMRFSDITGTTNMKLSSPNFEIINGRNVCIAKSGIGNVFRNKSAQKYFFDEELGNIRRKPEVRLRRWLGGREFFGDADQHRRFDNGATNIRTSQEQGLKARIGKIKAHYGARGKTSVFYRNFLILVTRSGDYRVFKA